jgi:hypothetical protein
MWCGEMTWGRFALFLDFFVADVCERDAPGEDKARVTLVLFCSGKQKDAP